MVKAVFPNGFNWSDPKNNAGFAIPASPEPQVWPRRVIEAAVQRGAATIVEGRTRERALKDRPNPKSKAGDHD